MADITLLNASYSDVPAVDLPRTGGGTARFYETASLEIGYKEAVSVGTAQVGTAVTGTPNYTPAGSVTLATEQQMITPSGEIATSAMASAMTLWLTAFFSPIPVVVDIPTRATFEGSGVTLEIQEAD